MHTDANYVVNTIELRKAMASCEINTAVELAAVAGIDRNTAGGILRGDIRPSSIVIEKIANALSLPEEMIGRIFFTRILT